MKRKDIVKKLMKEGLSDTMLAHLSDNQINMLAARVLSEQTLPPIPNVSGTDVKTIMSLKQQKKPFIAYENEIKEESKDKDDVIKRLKFKIEHEKDKKKVEDAKKLLAKLTSKKKEVDEGKFKSKTEWLKSKGIIKDDSKKETKEDSDTAEANPEHKKEKSEKPEKKEKSKKGEGGAEYEKRLAHGNFGGLSLNEWVNKVVEKNIHPFTSKSEIMELIKIKLTESNEVAEPEVAVELPDFLTFDAIKAAAEPSTKPITKPGTKPTTKPTPKTPFQPGPGPKHNPKAVAEEEKTKTAPPKVVPKKQPNTPFKVKPGIKHKPKA